MTENAIQWLNELAPELMVWGLKVIGGLAIFVVGRWVARLLTGIIKRMVLRAHPDQTLATFLGNIVYAALLVAVVIGALDTMGVATASLLALFGAAGLAIGLAMQGSLSNFASGVMLIVFRPFTAGHFVEVAGVSGTVESIHIFNTVLRTPDNREITVPNSQIYGETIVNYSAREQRRIDLVVGIGYDDDIDRAKQIIEEVLADESRVLEDPAPTIMVLELADSSVNIAVRPWVQTADYWPARGDLLHRLKISLEAAGLSIPYPQRDVHLHGEAAAA